MLHLHRSFLRALPSSVSITSTASRNSRSFISITNKSHNQSNLAFLSRPQRAAKLLYSFRRSFADNQSTIESAKEKVSAAAQSVKEAVSGNANSSHDADSNAVEQGRETAGVVRGAAQDHAYPIAGDSQREITQEKINSISNAESASEAGAEALRSVGQTARSTVDSIRDGPLSFESGGLNRSSKEGGESTELYLGNLYFELDEQRLREEFEHFGGITKVRIIKDPRGLSKGFGYVAFEDQATATEVRNTYNNRIVEGRRMIVQYATKTPTSRREPTSAYRQERRNSPTKTLYIGNMSFEMSDKDLNDLFRPIKNVLDVRVAIDRRTGQPRGFAHADFLDVSSAEAAAEYLESQEFYGRTLRIDFSANNRADSA